MYHLFPLSNLNFGITFSTSTNAKCNSGSLLILIVKLTNIQRFGFVTLKQLLCLQFVKYICKKEPIDWEKTWDIYANRKPNDYSNYIAQIPVKSTLQSSDESLDSTSPVHSKLHTFVGSSSMISLERRQRGVEQPWGKVLPSVLSANEPTQLCDSVTRRGSKFGSLKGRME